LIVILIPRQETFSKELPHRASKTRLCFFPRSKSDRVGKFSSKILQNLKLDFSRAVFQKGPPAYLGSNQTLPPTAFWAATLFASADSGDLLQTGHVWQAHHRLFRSGQ